MNRAERRRLEKQGKNVSKEPVISMKVSDLERIKNEARSEAVDTAMILLLGIPVKVLHDKYGWGMKKRLPEFAESLLDVYSDFSDGAMTLDEFRELIYVECGIKFEKEKILSKKAVVSAR